MNKIFSCFQSPFALFGLMGMFLFVPLYAVDLYNGYNGDSHIWWTNANMKLSMSDVSDKVEIYIKNEPLQKKIGDKALLVVGEDGSYRLVSIDDLKFRVNNWANTRLIRLYAASVTGVFAGVSIALFVIGLIQPYRNKKREDLSGIEHTE